MADNVDPNSPNINIDDEGVISLDDLDSLIAEEDPEFSQEMSVISADENLNEANVEVLDFEAVNEEIVEEKPSFIENHPRIQKVIKPVVVAKEKCVVSVRTNINKFHKKVYSFLTWLKQDFPGIAKQSGLNGLQKVKDFFAKLKSYVDSFKTLPKNYKYGIYLSIIFIGLIVGVVKFSSKKSWVPAITEPMYKTMEAVADKTYTFTAAEELSGLYKAFPQPEYFYTLDKFVVNLKRTNSYENPMIYIEFNLEVDSQSTAIELNDRKSQVLDVSQRAVEGFTKKELSTKSGLARMKAAVRYEINNILNQGRVIKVYLKRNIKK